MSLSLQSGGVLDKVLMQKLRKCKVLVTINAHTQV